MAQGRPSARFHVKPYQAEPSGSFMVISSQSHVESMPCAIPLESCNIMPIETSCSAKCVDFHHTEKDLVEQLQAALPAGTEAPFRSGTARQSGVALYLKQGFQF